MTENKRFTIDVEEETQENALFFGDKFVCFSDDIDMYLKLLNTLNDKNRKLNKFNQRLMKANNELSEDVDYYKSKSASCEQGLIYNERELERYKEIVKEVKTDEHQLSISFLEFKLNVKETLQKHYDDEKEYDLNSCEIIELIADDLGVELK